MDETILNDKRCIAFLADGTYRVFNDQKACSEAKLPEGHRIYCSMRHFLEHCPESEWSRFYAPQPGIMYQCWWNKAKVWDALTTEYTQLYGVLPKEVISITAEPTQVQPGKRQKRIGKVHNVCVYSPNGSISESDFSHRSAWVKMRLSQMGIQADLQPKPEELEAYDEVVVYLGMEWQGQLNLFGGACKENAERLMALTKAKKLSFLDEKVDLGTICSVRPGKDDGWTFSAWPELTEACRKAEVLHQPLVECSRLVIGDSHALSQYMPGSGIMRHDFKTLHGALEKGLYDFLPPNITKGEFDTFTWYFGNIDIRHHLMRQENPQHAAVELVDAYVREVEQVRSQLGGHHEIVAWLPIEDESRKIPSTGFYKGKPFFGTRQERSYLREMMMSVLHQAQQTGRIDSVYEWPAWFCDNDGKLKFEVMEKPQSVHLAWYYRREVLDNWPGKE